MAWSSLNTLGSANNKTAGTTIAMTTSATAEAGNVIIVWLAADNTTTTSGASTDLSVSDSAGNTYTRAIESTQSAGAGADGVTVGIFYTVVTTQLTSGGTITGAFSSRTASVISAWEFSFGAGSTISVAGSTSGGGVNSDPASITISSLTSQEYLWLHGLAEEEDGSDTFTQDADYTSITKNSTIGGLDLTNVTIVGGFRIFTGTTDTVDVGYTTSASRQWRQNYVALLENVAAGGGQPYAKRGGFVFGMLSNYNRVC